MTKPDFVYTTYIKTTPEKLWNAITNPEFTCQYWKYDNLSTDWKKGSEWKHMNKETGETLIVGKVLDSNPPKRLVLSWMDPEDKEDYTEVSFDIEAIEDFVRLNVVHGKFKADSTMAGKVSMGWPLVLANLKSFLETGKYFNIWAAKSGCNNGKAA